MPSSAINSATLYTTRDLLRDLWVFLAPYRWKFIVATLFRLAADIAWLYPAYGLAVLVTFLTKYSPGASLHEFFQSVTAVVIAHRLTTVREMDRIIVIEDGKIVEEGSFDELYQKQGRFHELWEKQKL